MCDFLINSHKITLFPTLRHIFGESFLSTTVYAIIAGSFRRKRSKSMWKECGKLLIAVDNSRLPGEWHDNLERTSLSQGTFGFDCAFVGINHCFYIA